MTLLPSSSSSRISVIAERLFTSTFNARQALTQDTVPVNVEAVVVWQVRGAQAEPDGIAKIQQFVDLVAQAAMHEMIRRSALAALLSERRSNDRWLSGEIERRAAEWGVTVRSVDISDVTISLALQAEDDSRSLLALCLCLTKHRVRREVTDLIDGLANGVQSQRPSEPSPLGWEMGGKGP